MAIAFEPPLVVRLDGLGLDRGGHILVDRALKTVAIGSVVRVEGTDPHLKMHLQVWARGRGHQSDGTSITKGGAGDARWQGAERAGVSASVSEHAPPSWGLAARGALAELGGPELVGADLDEKSVLWADLVPKLYAQAVASQWDPNTAIDWDDPC